MKRILLISACLVIAGSGQALAAPSLGIVGASGSDEGQGVADQAVINWAEQLAETGLVDLGAFERDPLVRGEPRWDGYEYNWARGGASATSPTFRDLLPNDPRFETMLPFSHQVEGLTQQIEEGKIDIAFIQIGFNDLYIWTQIGGPLEGPGFDGFVANLLNAVFGAVASFRAAGDPAIIIAEIPVVPSTADHLVPAIEAYNAALRVRAGDEGVATVDMYAALDSRARVTRDGEVRIGRYRIPLDSVASADDLVPPDSEDAVGPCQLLSGMCATTDYALNFTIHDGIHVNTVVHGLAAKQFLKALWREHRIHAGHLSDREILAFAGLAQGRRCGASEPSGE